MMFIITELIRLKSENFFDLHVEIGMPRDALGCPVIPIPCPGGVLR